ncbi:hypothetical protein [Flavobacterium suncheonense]|uniref:Lipoprotein n=1 Tax=Flavobacterium suncheonense GH29-5 = DSM 17707 TaxID=1121899 RepID=A0A0A2M8R5_9FLAO|nr:hypothetical protein [Flavobacterium suncheonense]KGO89072.1 hypothetical protein Q764_09795 [Flavobacterium suncheonense GH29-5 = DSM 17707]
MYKAILVFSLCFFASCMRDNDSQLYRMNIDVVMKQNDSIQVFYTNDGTINFNEGASFWVKVKGKDKNQKIDIRFPKNALPTQVRLDLGRNPKQGEIIFNKFEFVYKNHKFEAKGKDIYKYFRIDQSNTVLDEKSGALTRKAQQPNGPSLYPNGYYLAVKLEELKFKK